MKEAFTKWQAWCDLILLAYFAPAEFFVRGVRVKAKRGCVYKGVLELADRWKWSRGKVERFLSYLETDKRISIQKSHVISCVSILNYDKYQQNESTNETTDKTTNRSTNESTYKNIKKNKKNKKNNILSLPESQNCDIGLDDEPDILQQLLEKVDSLSKRVEEMDSTPKKQTKKQVNPLITLGRQIFEERYSSLFDGGVYYWQAKDAVAMDSLTKKIKHSREQRGMSVENDDIVSGLKAFIDSISDQWILRNFSVTNINSKYNEIVAQAKSTLKENGRKVSSTREDRVRDAASVIALLEAEESGNPQ